MEFYGFDHAGLGFTVEPNGTDLIAIMTNAPCDKVTNTVGAAAGDFIYLRCIVQGEWMALNWNANGGWLDAN